MRTRLFIFFSLLAILTLAACGPQVAGAQAPASGAPLANELATEAPVDVSSPELAPINLAGPPMQVGSLFEYVDGSFLVAVPGGEFTMGHGLEDSPEHKVALGDFWIYRAEVTNDQYARCIAAGKCSPPSVDSNPGFSDLAEGNKPVVGVNYDQAAAYCEFVHGRLPTEAEWEKTARGPQGNIYPWGDAIPVCDLLNFSYCLGKSADVDTYSQGQSYYEALNMAGNVYEWVSDWYEASYYSESPLENPLGPEIGSRRSVRSSSFSSDAYQTEVARRFSANPVDHRNDLGFRCVVEDPTYFAPFCEQLGVYGQGPNGEQVAGWNPQVTCPAIDIIQGPYCNGTQPLTTVTFKGPAGSEVDSGNCAPFNDDPNKFTCDSVVTTSICADCTLQNIGQVGCSEHYQYDPGAGKCVWDGSGTPGNQCLTGYTYDLAQQCCSAQTGGGDVTTKPCPVGTTYVSQMDACLNYPASGTVCKTETIGLHSCEKVGRGGCPPGRAEVCTTVYRNQIPVVVCSCR